MENITGIETVHVPAFMVVCGWIRRMELFESLLVAGRDPSGNSGEMVSTESIEPRYSINTPSLDEAVESIKRCYPMLASSSCTVLDAPAWVLVEFTKPGDWQITALFKVLKAFFIAPKIDTEKVLANLAAVQDGPAREEQLYWRDLPLMRATQ